MNRTQLQQLYEIAQQEAEDSLVRRWVRDIVAAVTAKARLGMKVHAVQQWQGGDLTPMRKEALLSRLRVHFLPDIDIRIVDIPCSQPMLVVDWS